ncbi:hypothetical protein WI95_32320 [Burkholderia contaminans]|nr:hypothetical protein WI95_32320 [Burkholderia contaminans]
MRVEGHAAGSTRTHVRSVMRRARNLCDDAPLRIRCSTPPTAAPGSGPLPIAPTPETTCPQ